MATHHIGYSVDGMIALLEGLEGRLGPDPARRRDLARLNKQKARSIKVYSYCPTPTEPEPGVFRCPGHEKGPPHA